MECNINAVVMSPKTFKSFNIFALMCSLSQSQLFFLNRVQFNALNKVFCYYRLEVFTCFVLQHKIHIKCPTIEL